LKIETLSMKKGIAFNSSSPGHTRPWGQRRLKSWICQKLENASPELSSSLHQGRRSNMNHRSRSPPKPYSNASLILEEPYRPPLPATTTTSSGKSYHQRTSPDSRRETRPAVRDVPIGSWPLAGRELSSTARNQETLRRPALVDVSTTLFFCCMCITTN